MRPIIVTEQCLQTAATGSERQQSGFSMTYSPCTRLVNHHICRRPVDRGETMRYQRRIRTKNNVATSDNCVSNSPTTTVCTSSSSSSTSSVSSSQIIDSRSPLERQTTCRTTRFFVEDIMRPDFGLRHVPRQSNSNLGLDVGLCSLSTDAQQSSWSSSPSAPTTSRCATTTSATTSATLRHETSQPKITATHCDRKSLNDVNIQILPAWIFCTRYSDRPSSGSDTCMSTLNTIVEFIAAAQSLHL